MKNNKKVELSSYDKNWPEYFEKESQKIKNILGGY